jgi:hypothetical protein
MRRISTTESRHYGEIYDYLDRGELLKEPIPPSYERAWHAATAETFARVKGSEALVVHAGSSPAAV